MPRFLARSPAVYRKLKYGNRFRQVAIVVLRIHTVFRLGFIQSIK